MSNHSSGHYAEKVSSDYLISKGYKVEHLNWSTPMCEIDIVASYKNILYFFEVKYRSNDSQGGGLDYITPRKLKQMQFAAQIYVCENNYEGDYELGAIELSSDFKITSFINQID